MSNAGQVIANVRRLTHDQDEQNYATDPDEMLVHLGAAIRLVHAELGIAPTFSIGVGTLTAGNFATTLDPTVQYAAVLGLRLGSNQRMLDRKTPMEILALRGGSLKWNGVPWCYAMFEGEDQVVNVWVHNTQTSADTLDALYHAVESDVTSYAQNIPFARDGVSAVTYRLAAMCFATMSAEERGRLDLPPDFDAKMMAFGIEFTKNERSRINAQHKSSKAPWRRVPQTWARPYVRMP